jgi:hypothetical protein
MKYLFAFFILVHGLIHLMGFAKAFGYGNISQLTKTISKPAGFVWLLTALLFVATAITYLLKINNWVFIALLAVLVSQVLILTVWKDARFGSIANLIILVVAVLNGGSMRFESTYLKDVTENISRSDTSHKELLSETDLQHLPQPVQNYLHYCRVVGQPKVTNVRIVMEGQMRSKQKDWFTFRSEQYNFFNEPARLFFMKGNFYGFTVPGYHRYLNATASMQIRLFGLFPVVQKEGTILNKTETVTFFNDMCLLAPATLIDRRIRWEPINNTSCKAVFTNGRISIAATLYFNEQGQLIDFISNDRTDINDMKSYPFSTPVTAYQLLNGITTIETGDAIWHYSDSSFVYGKFQLKEIEFNIKSVK